MQTKVYHPPLHSQLATTCASNFGLNDGLLSISGHGLSLPLKIIKITCHREASFQAS